MEAMKDRLELAKEIIRMEAEEVLAMRDRLDESFGQAVEACLKAIESNHKIVVVGVGKSGNIGKKIAATLNSTGATTVVLSSQNALHGDLGIVSDGDCILALSYSGETSELLDLLPHLRRSESTLIAMTGKPNSNLGRYCDLVLDTSVNREACPLNLAPTSSSTAMLVMGDALAMVLLDSRGFTKEDFAKFHPGGSLGRALLTKVDDIMRTGSGLAIANDTITVTEAIQCMSDHRCGACILVDKNSKLSGIFTHGDFARAYQADPQLGTESIQNHMTRDPISILTDSLAMEALKILQQHRVDDLVVLDTEGSPIGLIDSQDLARLKLV